MNDGNERGQRIKARRERLGMTKLALADLAGISRGKIAEVESGEGNPRPETLGALEAALDKFEHETSGPYDDGPGGMVTYNLKGNFGVDVTLQGPVENMAELQASVAALLAQMQAAGQQGTEQRRTP